ncbi:hypothetical protein D3C87_1756880 [compost metagenome]
MVEPVLIVEAAGLSHPYLQFTFRSSTEMAHRLETALTASPYLMGDEFSATDLLLYSPFAWFPEATPDVPAVKAWIERCAARPSMQWAADFDASAQVAA